MGGYCNSLHTCIGTVAPELALLQKNYLLNTGCIVDLPPLYLHWIGNLKPIGCLQYLKARAFTELEGHSPVGTCQDTATRHRHTFCFPRASGSLLPAITAATRPCDGAS